LQDKANEKINALRGKHKARKKEAKKEMDDLGTILRT